MNSYRWFCTQKWLVRIAACMFVVLGCEHKTPAKDSSVDERSAVDAGTMDGIGNDSLAYQDEGLPENFDGSVPALVLGSQLACSLEVNGEVYCWGYDQLLSRIVPGFEEGRANRMPGFRGIVQLSDPSNVLCGVDSQGEVWCMGDNTLDFLQVGSSETPILIARRRLDVREMVEINVTTSFFGRDRSGALYGHNTLPPRVQRLPLPAPGVAIGISKDSFGYCVLLSSRRVACYPLMPGRGAFENGPMIEEGLEGIVSVSAGYDHACALKEDGTVWCWGHNESGQTGTPPEVPDVCTDPQTSYYCIRTPRRVEGLNDVDELHAGTYMTCVRRRDRTLWCWGNNDSVFSPSRGPGLIGDGLPNTEMCLDPSGAARPCRRRPSRVQGLTNVATFATGGGGCARLLSGETWCWGYAGRVASTTPVQIPFPDLSRDR